MEGNTLIINSNNSCLMCFEKLGKVHQKQLIFAIQELAHKLNVDLGFVFPDMKARFGGYEKYFSKVLGKLQVFCSMCQDCAYICTKLEQSDLREPSGEVKVDAKVLLDKISKVELSDGYNYADYLTTPNLKPLALIHFGTVERLRIELKKMLQMVKENPLENDIVQCNILSFLEASEVKKCRLLNKQWNSNCYRILKRMAASSQNKFRGPYLCRKEILELLSKLESGSQYPLAQKINVSRVLLRYVDCEEIILKLFNAVSLKITDLTLCLPNPDYYDGDGHVMVYPPGLTLPHLASLWLGVDCYAQQFWQIEFIKGIIQNSPNLKEISIYTAVSNYPRRFVVTPAEVYQPFVDTLLEKGHLTSLSLESPAIQRTHYDQLAKAGLKLKKLHLIPKNNARVSANLFLESQLESLEELQVDFTYAQFELGRMRMVKLKVLKIVEHRCSNRQDCNCQNVWNFNQRISFKKQFPALEDLQLQNVSDEGRIGVILHLGRSVDDIGRSVKKLKLYFWAQLSPQIIENAAELFPNLTKLEVGARLEILKKVYVKMGKLQELILNHDRKYMEQYGTKKMDNLLRGMLPVEYDRPFNPEESLLRLTELRTLRIKTHDDFIIGEQACRHIFMKMESIKLITFSFFDKHRNNNLYYTGILPSLLDELRKKIVILTTRQWNM